MTAFWFVVSIFAGIGYAFSLICDEDNSCVVIILGVIFFPIVLIIGILMSFKELFCEVFAEDVLPIISSPFEILGEMMD